MVTAARQNRPYLFLQTALPYLIQVPADDEVRVLALQHLAQLGLFGPAVELVDDHPDLLTRVPDLAPSVAPLREQPTGQIPWGTLAPTFEQNLVAARERFEVCREHEGPIREGVRDLALFRTSDGSLLLSRRIGQTPRQWLPALLNWSEVVRQASLGPEDTNSLCLPYLFEGVGLGHAIRQLHDATSRMFLTYTPRIHVIEPNLAQLAAWLHVEDHRDLLRDERFHLWAGKEGAAAFIAFHRSRPKEFAPVAAVCQPGWGPGAVSVAKAAVDRLKEEADERCERSKQAIHAKLADRSSPAHYAARFEQRSEHPLRILGVTSRYTTFLQYSMRDIQQAAADRGHEFRILIEDNDHTPMLPVDHILQQIEELMPDLIVILDHNRKEYDGQYDFPIPFCNWIQDDLPNLFGPGCGSDLHLYDLVVSVIGGLRARSAGYPPDQWKAVPVPVSLGKFSHEPVSEDDRRAHECDLSFVSHRNISREELLREALSQVTQPQIRQLLEAQYERIGPQIAAGRLPGTSLQTVLQIQALARELDFALSYDDADRVRQMFTDRLINSHFREQVLEWASDMGLDLHLYGRGWDEHPTLAKHARGTAKHGHQLRCIYQASRINLQAVSTGAVHQRLVEGLSSGGFFVIRRTPSDALGPLRDAIRRRCQALDIQTEEDLWNAPDEALARDVRILNGALFAPARLRPHFVSDLCAANDRGFSMQAGSLLPHYDEVSFGTREEFERVVTRFLKDEPVRHEIARDQRETVVSHFGYEAVFERLLDFGRDYFASLATKEPCLAASG